MTPSTPGSTTRSEHPAHLVHDELAPAEEMLVDCRAAGRNLGLEGRLEQAARAAVAGPPSIRFEDYPSEVGKREIRVSDAAARIAAALHLHLD